MKYCSKCGKELLDEAVICVGCGCPVSGGPLSKPSAPQEAPFEKKESPGTANCALVFAFLIPIVGLIMGIYGWTKYKDSKLRRKCITAIICSIFMWIVGLLVLAA